ncbi:MAG TPA: DUF1028 domain-containing protein [Rubricoccaceae bacterium]|jgi:uncharacterized Ntn-hydrolase superfamily protein
MSRPTLRRAAFVCFALILVLLVAVALVWPPPTRSAEAPPVGPDGAPLVSTFSIVAVDTTTGEMGIAVQSKFPNVRAVVPWAEAGAGAVATQSFARLDYGRRGLVLMRNGATADEALRILIREDPNPETRQVGLVDAQGNAATWTGAAAFEWRGGRVGEASGGVRTAGPGEVVVGKGFAVQGNILVSAETVDAMATAFVGAEGQPLAARLMAALVAGGAAGGDRRGEQSAALLVVRAGAGYDGSDTVVDISVYDHPTPIAELARLYALNDLYFTDTRPENLVPVTPEIARELQQIWRARGFSHHAVDGVVDADFQRTLVDFMGWENYDLRVDEVQRVNLAEGEPLMIDREVLADIRDVFQNGRFRPGPLAPLP